MNKKILTTREISDAVDQILRKKYHLNRIFLYGSYSKDRAKQSSDVDLIVLDEEVPKGMKFLQMISDMETVLDKSVTIQAAKYFKREEEKKLLEEIMETAKEI